MRRNVSIGEEVIIDAFEQVLGVERDLELSVPRLAKWDRYL